MASHGLSNALWEGPGLSQFSMERTQAEREQARNVPRAADLNLGRVTLESPKQAPEQAAWSPLSGKVSPRKRQQSVGDSAGRPGALLLSHCGRVTASWSPGGEGHTRPSVAAAL